MAINFPLTPNQGDTHTDGSNTWEYNGSAWDALYTATKAQVGLSNVDNTSDADKPVSTLTQAAIDAAGGGAFDADANTLITASTPIVLDQATDEAALTLDYTTNKASGIDTGLLINQTDTLTSGTSNLLDLQVGGASKATANAAGDIDIVGSYKKDGVTILDTDSTLLNTSVGSAALSDALLTGAGNTAAGYHALNQNTTGDGNSAMGYNALGSNTTGTYNNGSGYRPLFSNTEGDYNSAIGYRPLFSNTHGSGNNAMGYNALGSNIDGNYNNAIGYSALYNNVSGSYGIALGFNALLNSTSAGNIGIGASAGSGISSGSYNLAAGHQTFLNANGSHNIALGWQSARYQSGGTVDLTSADDSIFIGKSTKGVQSATNQIVIGDSAEGLGSNTVVLGADSVVTTALKGNVGITSTWNDAADTFTLIKADVTDTASAAGSNLLDLQVGGTSKFSVAANGAVAINATGANEPTGFGIGSPATSLLGVWGGNRWCNAFGSDRMVLDSTSWLGFSSLAGSNDSFPAGINVDVRLNRDAAGTLAQRNGVNAQTFNIYNTYTNASNYERGHIGWNDPADTFVIGTEAAGAGTLRGLSLGAQGNSVSLYGVTPVAQASHIADATNATDVITRVNAILVALENIGITASV